MKALYDDFVKYFEKMREKEIDLTEKAKERRERKKEPVHTVEITEEDEAMAAAPKVDVSSVINMDVEEVPFFIDVYVCSLKVPFLVDNGAVVSLMTMTTWNRIPDAEKLRIPVCTVAVGCLTGPFGKGNFDFVAEIPLTIQGKMQSQRFFLGSENTQDLLGLDAQHNFDINVSVRERTVDIRYDDGSIEEIPPSVYHTPELVVNDVFGGIFFHHDLESERPKLRRDGNKTRRIEEREAAK